MRRRGPAHAVSCSPRPALDRRRPRCSSFQYSCVSGPFYNPPRPVALTPGTRFGPYEVAAQIGVGGMGEVYRAADTNLKRAVAIKVLPASCLLYTSPSPRDS